MMTNRTKGRAKSEKLLASLHGSHRYPRTASLGRPGTSAPGGPSGYRAGRRGADFLLAWHNAAENGGWDPVDIWNVDDAIAEDMLTVMHLVKESRRYPGDLGFEEEIQTVWRMWRRNRTDPPQPR
jgi:hypothetical protein